MSLDDFPANKQVRGKNFELTPRKLDTVRVYLWDELVLAEHPEAQPPADPQHRTAQCEVRLSALYFSSSFIG